MNILIDVLPDTVDIEGMKYKINTDFRISMMFELLMQDNALLDEEKIEIALNLYYPDIPHNLKESVDKLLWFYKCGKSIENNYGNEEETTNKIDIIYSFEHDDDYI